MDEDWDGTAAALSIIPGLGHIYKGQVINGFCWMICTIALYPILIGIVMHVICIRNAGRL